MAKDAEGRCSVKTTLRLGYPPSTNKLYRYFRGRAVLSPAGREYKALAADLARQAGAVMITGPVRLEVTLHAKKPLRKSNSPVRRIDLSNSLKVAEDALSGILYVDDHQTHEIAMNVGEPIPGGALVITVSAIGAIDPGVLLPMEQPI